VVLSQEHLFLRIKGKLDVVLREIDITYRVDRLGMVSDIDSSPWPILSYEKKIIWGEQEMCL